MGEIVNKNLVNHGSGNSNSNKGKNRSSEPDLNDKDFFKTFAACGAVLNFIYSLVLQ